MSEECFSTIEQSARTLGIDAYAATLAQYAYENNLSEENNSGDLECIGAYGCSEEWSCDEYLAADERASIKEPEVFWKLRFQLPSREEHWQVD